MYIYTYIYIYIYMCNKYIYIYIAFILKEIYLIFKSRSLVFTFDFKKMGRFKLFLCFSRKIVPYSWTLCRYLEPTFV